MRDGISRVGLKLTEARLQLRSVLTRGLVHRPAMAVDQTFVELLVFLGRGFRQTAAGKGPRKLVARPAMSMHQAIIKIVVRHRPTPNELMPVSRRVLSE